MAINSNILLLHNSLPCANSSPTLLFRIHRRRHLCPPQAHKLLAACPAEFNSWPVDNCGNGWRLSSWSSQQMGFPHKHQFSISPGSSLVFSPRALGSDTSMDTDDMFDDLFKKHGKVVFRRNDQKSAAAEIDDDAESLSFAVAAAKVASEVKAGDIKVLFVKPLVYWTRFFIIVTAFSRPQIDAIGTKIRDMAEDKFGRVAAGDSKPFRRVAGEAPIPNSWTLLDFGHLYLFIPGDVVVHIFLPQQRAFYNLEEFYGNATVVELPLES